MIFSISVMPPTFDSEALAKSQPDSEQAIPPFPEMLLPEERAYFDLLIGGELYAFENKVEYG